MVFLKSDAFQKSPKSHQNFGLLLLEYLSYTTFKISQSCHIGIPARVCGIVVNALLFNLDDQGSNLANFGISRSLGSLQSMLIIDFGSGIKPFKGVSLHTV